MGEGKGITMEARRLPISYQRKALEVVSRLKKESGRSNWERRDTATGVQYCVHGTMIGTWDGPDYMCGPCEDGMGHYAYALMVAWDMYRRDRKTIGRLVAEAIRDTIWEACKDLEACPLTPRERWALMEPAMELS